MRKELRIKNYAKTEGFTLVELLVVMGIMVMVSMIVGSIFVLSLRGAKKSNSINAINQNGLYALSVMSNILRNGQHFIGTGSSYTSSSPYGLTQNCLGSSEIGVTDTSGATSILQCNATDSNNKPNIASISASTNSTKYLLNTTDVTLTSCSITCTQLISSKPPVVTINFTLSKFAVNGSANLEEDSANTNFSTTVSLRNN